MGTAVVTVLLEPVQALVRPALVGRMYDEVTSVVSATVVVLATELAAMVETIVDVVASAVGVSVMGASVVEGTLLLVGRTEVVSRAEVEGSEVCRPPSTR